MGFSAQTLRCSLLLLAVASLLDAASVNAIHKQTPSQNIAANDARNFLIRNNLNGNNQAVAQQDGSQHEAPGSKNIGRVAPRKVDTELDDHHSFPVEQSIILNDLHSDDRQEATVVNLKPEHSKKSYLSNMIDNVPNISSSKENYLHLKDNAEPQGNLTEHKELVDDGLRQSVQKESVKREDGVLAFTARLSQDRNIAAGSPILFDEVITNVGGSSGSGLYFPDSGIFVCLDEDYYMFSVTMQGANNSLARARLMRGSDIIKAGLETTNRTTANNIFTGTSEFSIVAQCQVNVAFRVEAVKISESSTTVTFKGIFTSFSGYRLPNFELKSACTAELSTDTNIFPEQKITLDTEISDIGGDYIPNHGTFICPDAGVYAVSTSIKPAPGMRVMSAILHAGQEVLEGPVSWWIGSTSEPYRAGGVTSITILVQCAPETAIWTVSKNNSHAPGYNTFIGTSTSMTVLKVSEDPGTIAFSALLTQRTDWEEDKIIVYDTIIMNEGSHYDPVTGSFTCPDSDMYLFSVSLTVYASAQVKLMMNAVEVNRGPWSDYNIGVYGSGTSTTTTIAKCSEGAKVTVRFGAAIYSDSYDAYALGEFNTFTGYKILT